jgi:hypothetical protein
MVMKNLRIKVFVLLLVMITASCSAKPEVSSRNTTYKIQEWIEVGEFDIYVHEVNKGQDITNGKRSVYIEVEYANNRSTEELSCRRNQWYLYDDQGYSYEAESGSEMYESKDLQYLGGDRFVNQGMKLRGWLVFQVPEEASIERIQFITGFIGTETADIILDE